MPITRWVVASGCSLSLATAIVPAAALTQRNDGADWIAVEAMKSVGVAARPAQGQPVNATPKCGWIADFRGASGTRLSPLLAAIDPIRSSARLSGASVIDRQSQGVAILVDGTTQGAGAVAAALMKLQQPTRVFGTDSDVLPAQGEDFSARDRQARLTDGTILAADVLFSEGARVVPNESIAAQKDSDEVLQRATEWLTSQCVHLSPLTAQDIDAVVAGPRVMPLVFKEPDQLNGIAFRLDVYSPEAWAQFVADSASRPKDPSFVVPPMDAAYLWHFVAWPVPRRTGVYLGKQVAGTELSLLSRSFRVRPVSTREICIEGPDHVPVCGVNQAFRDRDIRFVTVDGAEDIDAHVTGPGWQWWCEMPRGALKPLFTGTKAAP
jgi:hypothetical protein